MLKTISTYSWIITAVTLLAGTVLNTFEIVDWGLAFFILFPLSAGFSSGLSSGNTDKVRIKLLYTTLGFLIFSTIILVLGIEGMVCVIMASPLMILFLIIGFWIGVAIRKKYVKRHSEKNTSGFIIFLPVILLLLSNFIESFFSGEPISNSITTSMVLPYGPVDVFHHIKEMDTLDGRKPFLLKLGLPSPHQCILDADTINATRTCLFDDGKIVAKVTEYQPGKLLSMKVTEYTVTGWRWFTFGDAFYTFESDGVHTKITRTTHYTSLLKPRIYWKPLETMAIEQEHTFVLNSLEKNLKKTFRRLPE